MMKCALIFASVGRGLHLNATNAVVPYIHGME